ncbi:MAG: glycoside hydrolase family 16 protein [Sporichthyaceae bacterium]
MRFKLIGLLVAVVLVIAGGGAFLTLRDSGSGADRAGSGELVLRPPVGQSKDGATAMVPAVATFTPARKGAKVTIQRQAGAGWETVTRGAQDIDGRFAFLLPSGDTQSYRAKTQAPGKDIFTAAVSSSPWKFTWGDEFDGSALREHWSVLPTGAFAGRPCAVATADTAVVKDGIVSILAKYNSKISPFRTETCPEGHFRNAQFGTHESRLFSYGVFAARLRTQATEGMHSAFWLYPHGDPPVDIPADDLPSHKGVEIDVVEYFGDKFGKAADEGKTYSYVYWPRQEADGTVTNTKDGGAQDIEPIIGAGKLPSEGFHVYSVEWTPTEYIFRTDGVETSRVTNGVSRRPLMLLLSMLSSGWETPRLTEDSLPAAMDVDWVRVYQRDAANEGIPAGS